MVHRVSEGGVIQYDVCTKNETCRVSPYLEMSIPGVSLVETRGLLKDSCFGHTQHIY